LEQEVSIFSRANSCLTLTRQLLCTNQFTHLCDR